jgi:hypothetical protein
MVGRVMTLLVADRVESRRNKRKGAEQNAAQFATNAACDCCAPK